MPRRCRPAGFFPPAPWYLEDVYQGGNVGDRAEPPFKVGTSSGDDQDPGGVGHRPRGRGLLPAAAGLAVVLVAALWTVADWVPWGGDDTMEVYLPARPPVAHDFQIVTSGELGWSPDEQEILQAEMDKLRTLGETEVLVSPVGRTVADNPQDAGDWLVAALVVTVVLVGLLVGGARLVLGRLGARPGVGTEQR